MPILGSGLLGAHREFSLRDIGGLQVWYDYTDLATLFSDLAATTPATGGGRVRNVRDKSNNANHAKISDASDGLLLTNDGSGQNGKAFVSGDGANDYLALTSNLSVSSFTAFCIGKRVAATDKMIAGGDSVAGKQISFWSDNRVYIVMGTVRSAVVDSNVSVKLFTWRNATGASDVWRDSTNVATGAELTGTLDIHNVFRRASDYSKSEQYEFAFYSPALSLADITRAWAYFSTKYSLGF